MVSSTPSGVVGVDLIDIMEVFGQVQGYFSRVSYLVDQTHCEMLNSVVNPKPTQTVEVGRGEVGSGCEAK